MSYPKIETLEKLKIKGQDFFFCLRNSCVFFPESDYFLNDVKTARGIILKD